MSEITIVIPNYNGINYIEECLLSLDRQTIKEYHTIVVDNCSTDGSDDLVARNHPDVQLLCLDKNYGFSYAVNRGIEIANSKYVLLLNNDTIVTEDFVENMKKSIDKSEKIFSVSAKMIQMSAKDKIDSAGDMYCALGWAYSRFKDKKISRGKMHVNIFSACAGAAIYRKSVFEKIGMFDKNHYVYLEDVDIGYRAKLYGYENRFEPTAVVYHAGSAVSGSRHNEFKVRISAKNNVYLLYKNMPFLQLLINLPLLFLGGLVKYIFFVRKKLNKSYLDGVKEGFAFCRTEEARGNKVRFKVVNLWNYIIVEVELIINMFLKIIY